MRFRLTILAFAVVLIAGAAFASITLTNNYSLTQGATTVETDTTAVASYMQVDWQANNVRLGYKYGSGGNAFSAGQTVGDLIVSIDLGSGNYTTNKGAAGTISGTQLTTLQNTVKTWRNNAENFAVNQGFLGGTQVAW